MTGCLFCQCELHVVVVENASCYARVDPFGATEGHLEVVPRRHVDRLFDLSRAEAADAWALLIDADRALRDRGIHADGYNIGVNDGPAAGRTIDHLHIHLIPRRHRDVEDPRGGIRRGLPNGDPDRWQFNPPPWTPIGPAASTMRERDETALADEQEEQDSLVLGPVISVEDMLLLIEAGKRGAADERAAADRLELRLHTRAYDEIATEG